MLGKTYMKIRFKELYMTNSSILFLERHYNWFSFQRFLTVTEFLILFGSCVEREVVSLNFFAEAIVCKIHAWISPCLLNRHGPKCANKKQMWIILILCKILAQLVNPPLLQLHHCLLKLFKLFSSIFRKTLYENYLHKLKRVKYPREYLAYCICSSTTDYSGCDKKKTLLLRLGS